MAFSYGLRIGKYEILNKLGHGGYGIVYAARDTELDRDLAIKFLRPDYLAKPEVVRRFLQEARAVAKIVHPGIVTVYEAGHVEASGTDADGTVYIAMELLHGDSLASRIDGERQLPIETVVELGAQLAAALEAAHRKGIVHRDLKPDNIFVLADASIDGGERIKILDFGIAKLGVADRPITSVDTGATGVHTHSMMMLGTPRYMSPEQCKSSARVDHRSDIYSLGCILYELVCGKSPFDGDAGELIAKHQLAPVPRPRGIRPEVTAYLDVLITTMLAKEPDDRPQSMERVREALLAGAGGAIAEPPVATTLSGSAGEPTESPAPRKSNRVRIAAAIAALPLGIAIGFALGGEGHTPPPPQHEPAIALPVADAAVPSTAAKELECRKLAADRKWDDVLHCADQLAKLTPDTTPVVRELTTMGVIEARNAVVFAKLEDAVAQADIADAYRWLDRIDDESVYKDPAADEVEKLAAMPAVHPIEPARHCNADNLAQHASQAITQGQYSTALSLIESSLRCKPDSSLYRLALLAACDAGNAAKAKRYFARIPAAQQTAMAQLCARNKITLP